jgi:hypothetical protein
MIYIDSRKKKEKTLRSLYPNAILADVTSKATTGLVKLSPFYPHGNIPVPYSEGIFATCVEAVWQGLKVFENADVDISLFENDTMKNIKRSVRKYGKPLGHRKGVNGTELLNYLDARLLIYLPTYRWVLENKVQDIIIRLREASIDKDIVLLDYEINGDIYNTSKPLSHASLIKAFVEKAYPEGTKFLNIAEDHKAISDVKLPDKKKKRREMSKSKKTDVIPDAIQTNLFWEDK